MILWLLVFHAVSTLMMAGLIWFVQIVHYPLFAMVGDADFRAYELSHQRRTAILVGPLMLAEAASTVALLVTVNVPGMWWMLIVGVVLLAAAWISTWFVQVPCHRKLEQGLDSRVVSSMVVSNWIRTAAWSVRGGLAVWLLVLGAKAVGAD